MGGVRWLATLDGYAVEGGLDVPGGPYTCYAPAGQLGHCALPGDAAGLWSEYELALDGAAALGLDGVRLTLEWARLEPDPDRWNTTAADRYRAVLRAARSRGLWTTVVVVDAAWPGWLGPEAWLLPWVAPRAVAHVKRIAGEFGGDAEGLVIFARSDSLADGGFVRGERPPWRRRAHHDAQTAHEQLAAISAEASRDADVARLLVPSFCEIPVVRDVSSLTAMVAVHRPAAEVHLRSLVAGDGPTAAVNGLLRRDGGRWVPAAGFEGWTPPAG